MPQNLKLLYTLLCDDVRLEVGNKLSFMGVFQNIMVQQLPLPLLKFAVVNHWQGEGTFLSTVQILTPDKKIFSGDVYGVQLPGISGMFEVLEKHAPLVSALKAGRLKILKDKNTTALYTIQSGFVEVLNNKATVLVEGAKEAG